MLDLFYFHLLVLKDKYIILRTLLILYFLSVRQTMFVVITDCVQFRIKNMYFAMCTPYPCNRDSECNTKVYLTFNFTVILLMNKTKRFLLIYSKGSQRNLDQNPIEIAIKSLQNSLLCSIFAVVITRKFMLITLPRH